MGDFRAKSDEIERKKAEMKEKIQAQLSRVNEETKKLAGLNKELEVHVEHADPTKKAVSSLRKKIDSVDKDLRKLGRTCNKKEREYKEAKEAFNHKTTQKAELMDSLFALVSESERVQMMKLEELSKNMDSLVL